MPINGIIALTCCGPVTFGNHLAVLQRQGKVGTLTGKGARKWSNNHEAADAYAP
jgi:hypothetical protein